MKRAIDILFSAVGLIVTSPILVPTMIAVWLYDRHSPFYRAARVGKDEKIFTMLKLRSMVVNADRSGVDSTAANDRRITPVGHFIRKFKLDELTQLYNVLLGDMSLVGPRPNVKRETDLYTKVEKRLLTVKPGITDFSSIVFSDEGEILRGSPDPDLDYNQLIRPWKSRLGLFYIDNRDLLVDLKLIALTAVAIGSRRLALRGVQSMLRDLHAELQLLDVAARIKPLKRFPPPGATELATRDLPPVQANAG
jgi:lipopolysaccharide/colanic/teichoic acid biosynthesis glycosyltransferase